MQQTVSSRNGSPAPHHGPVPGIALALMLAVGWGVMSTPAQSEDPVADHPWVQSIERYLEARHDGETSTVQEILSEDSRIWFGEKVGSGSPRRPGGAGPWSEWDRFFRSETRVLDYFVEESSVRTLVWEINDWYRLVERPASVYYVTYYFDADGRIEGTLIHSLRNPPPRTDRLDEFQEWAERKHPGLLDELMPDGEIDPALDKARRWKQMLTAWRAEAG